MGPALLVFVLLAAPSAAAAAPYHCGEDALVCGGPESWSWGSGACDGARSKGTGAAYRVNDALVTGEQVRASATHGCASGDGWRWTYVRVRVDVGAAVLAEGEWSDHDGACSLHAGTFAFAKRSACPDALAPPLLP